MKQNKYTLRVREVIDSTITVTAETLEEAKKLFEGGCLQTEVRFPETCERVDWDVIDGWEHLG